MKVRRPQKKRDQKKAAHHHLGVGGTNERPGLAPPPNDHLEPSAWFRPDRWGSTSLSAAGIWHGSIWAAHCKDLDIKHEIPVNLRVGLDGEQRPRTI